MLASHCAARAVMADLLGELCLQRRRPGFAPTVMTGFVLLLECHRGGITTGT